MRELNRKQFIERYQNLFEGRSEIEISSGSGIKLETIKSILSQKTYPNLITIFRLKEFFNCSTDYLLGLTDEKNPPVTYSDIFRLLKILLDNKGIIKAADEDPPYDTDKWHLQHEIYIFLKQYNFILENNLGPSALERWKIDNFEKLFSPFGFINLKMLKSDTMKSLVSKNIDKLIKHSKLKPFTLSEQTGLTPTQIHNYTYGLSLPDIESLYKLSTALDCSLDAFLRFPSFTYEVFISQLNFLCSTFNYNDEYNSFNDSVIDAFLSNYINVRLDFVLFPDLVENWSDRVIDVFNYPVGDYNTVLRMKQSADSLFESDSQEYKDYHPGYDSDYLFDLLALKNALSGYKPTPKPEPTPDMPAKADEVNFRIDL